MSDVHDLHRPRTSLFFSWRDTHNPEGGGAERYLEKMAGGLVDRGCRVTIFCAAHAGGAAGRDRRRRAVRPPRHQARRLHGRACRALLRRDARARRRRGRRAERAAVLHPPGDPQAGHRAGPPRAPRAVAGRLPRPHRARRLVDRAPPGAPPLPPLPVRRGVARDPGRAGRARRRPRRAIAVVHNGTDPVVAGRTPARRRTRASAWWAGWSRTSRSSTRSTPRSRCAASSPTCGSHVVGSGWWEAELHEYAAARGAGDTVVFDGHVDERRKHEIYERSWVMALPSLKEGWGLVVGEAGMHGTPTVAYRSAGGTRESIDRRTLRRAGRRRRRASPRRSAPAPRPRVARAAGEGAHGDEPPVHLGARAGVLRLRRGLRVAGETVDSQDPGDEE